MTELELDLIRQDFPMLCREIKGKPLIYLDSAATGQKPLAMVDCLYRFYTEEYSKIDETHGESIHVSQLFEAARAKVAGLLNARPEQVAFLRGATEAISRVALGFADVVLKKDDEVLISAMEHDSNIIPWQLACKRSGARLVVAPVTPEGDLDLEQFEAKLSERTRVVAVTHVSNVFGTVVPVKQVVELAHARGAAVLVDGAQAAPHLPVDVREIDCDLYVASAHKMGGPSSVGFLYGKTEWLDRLPPQQGGETMSGTVTFQDHTEKPSPKRWEAGTPAFAEVIAFGAAVDYWTTIGLERIAAYERELTRYVVDQLSQIPGLTVVGAPADRISCVSFTLEGHDPQKLEQRLDEEAGIAVRGGTLSAQPLMTCLGLPGVVRASVMFYNTRADVDALVRELRRVAAE